MKPTKAYLVEESHTGFGFRVSPVIVLVVNGDMARVALLNITENSAWVPTLGHNWPVRVANLASTRLRALAKIALRLRDVEERLAPHFAIQPEPSRSATTATHVGGRTAAPARVPASPTSGARTHGGPRRGRTPWYLEKP